MDEKSLVISQSKLKLLVGGLGIGLPTVLYLGNLWIFDVDMELGSISSYYHSNMRDVFVGFLFAISVFMIAYEGYNLTDRLLSSFGGLLGIVVALFPTSPEGEARDLVGTIHLVAAAGFFFILMIFCLFLFTKSDPLIPKTKLKRLRNLIYYICGLSILISIIAIIVSELSIVTIPLDNSTFWLEYIMNSAFGTAWLVKGEGLFFLNDDPILQMNPWEVFGFFLLVILAASSGFMLLNIFFT